MTASTPPASVRRAVRVAIALTALTACAQDAEPAADVTIALGVLPGLRYDLPRFRVDPGARVAIRFSNGDEMAHNVVVTRPGRREAVVQAALDLGPAAPDAGYVPDSPDVLAALRMVDPGGSGTLRFTAPTEPCVLGYVCTFPGHGAVMFGAIHVGTDMPADLTADVHVSPLWREDATAGQVTHAHGATDGRRLHPWPPDRRPLLYRIFMPDASPAAIAIALPGDVSACWDAGTCRLRYAWHGGFVDPWPVWKGNGNDLAAIEGERFWVEAAFPLTIPGVDAQPAPRFRGYRLGDDGLPEFHYELGSVTVHERLEVLADGAGLRRRFRVDGLPDGRALHVDVTGEGTGTLRAAPFALPAGGLDLTAGQAAEFVIEVLR